jgi:AcrR family transcriptional regulator
VLAAADAVFAAHGASASTEDVARAAGVGVGTVFRHFPTKEALLEAVLVNRLERVAQTARTAAVAADPGAAFDAFFDQVVAASRGKTALGDALAEAGIDLEHATAAVKRDLHAAISTLLARAQQAGAVRADLGPPELFALLVAASRAVEHLGDDRALQARTVAVIVDGLRPRPADPTPQRPPPPASA